MRQRRSLVYATIAASSSLVACGSDHPAPSAPAAPATTSAAPAALPAPSAQKPNDPSLAGRKDFPEAEFTETDRSRDPFRSFIGNFVDQGKPRATIQHPVILSDFAVDELKLVGIVTRIVPARAMLVDPTGKGHVVHRGDFVGRADIVQLGGQAGATYQLNWRLDRIRDGDVVLVREDPNNPDVPAATKVIPLRPEAADDKASGG